MDEDEREKEKRDVPNVSENRKKDWYNSFFRELRALIQAHGYPVKGDRSKTSQGKVNTETSREISNWIPSFQSYEDFKCKTLQSLDGFMIILSADGVIVFVAGNITPLLGHLPDEVVGKNLLSLLPDNEKSEVYRKIAFKRSLSSSVGKHIDFCCHIKRGNDNHGSNPTYEYAKFFLTLKDISVEPLAFFSSFFPSSSFAESSGTYLPLEDRFYLVGSICILRTQTLRDLFTVEKAGEDIQQINDSDGEHLSTECRSVQGQTRSSRMESLFAEPAAIASDDQADLVTLEQNEPEGSVHESGIRSATCYDSSTSSMESIPETLTTSSSQSIQFEPEVEQVDDMDETQQVDEAEEVEQVDKEEEVEQVEEVEDEEVEQVEEVEQEAFSSSSVAAGVSNQLLRPPSLIALYISKEEMELMRKFRKQLEEKSRMLQSDFRSLQDALEMMKEQLYRIQDSGFQMQPTTSHHLDCPEPQSLEPVPKKPRTVKMKGPFPDSKGTSLSRGSYSSRYFKFPEKPKEPCNTSKQNQHIVDPVQLVVRHQSSDCSQDENLGDHEDDSQSFLPEDEQGSSMYLLPLVCSPISETGSSTNFSESPINSDSMLVNLENTQDYIQFWQHPPDPQYHLYFQMNTCLSTELATLQDQATWPQVPATETRIQGSPDSEVFQDPDELTSGQVNCFTTAEQSSLDEHQRDFHTDP